MTSVRLPVAVIFQRTPLDNRWVSERWDPVAVLPVAEDAPTRHVPAKICDDPKRTQWLFDGHVLELHRSEAEGYYLNLTAPEPKVFVMWRREESGGEPPLFPVIVTVSYNEAARMLDGGEQVDAVPLPDDIRLWMQPFVTANYTPEPRQKIRRNDPFADESRPRRGRH